MTYLAGLLFMVLGIIVSVALHEVGHLLPAKKFGALVPEYAIGFGPTLFARTFRGTQYAVKAVLLGGYVRIVGMFPPGKQAVTAGSEGRVTIAEDARLQSARDIQAARDAGLDGKPFYQLTTAQKLTVMLGGPLMNLLLAFVLTAVTLMGFGWNQATTTIDEVVDTNAEMGLDQDGQTPAAAAGLHPGDTIVAWAGEDVDTWEELRVLMAQTPASGADALVLREGEELAVHVTPVFDEAGSAKIGVVAGQVRVRGTIGDAVTQTGALFTGTASALVKLPVSLWQLGESFVTGAARDPAGVMSVVGVARVAGEVTSVDTGGAVSAADRLAVLLSLLASLNMALFVFNLIPLPPLDGGHVAGALWGGVKNLWARVRGLPRPAPPDTARMMPLANGVFVALMVMTVVLIAADLFNPLQLF